MRTTKNERIRAFGGIGTLVGFFLALTITFNVLAILPLLMALFFYAKIREMLGLDAVWNIPGRD